MLIKKYALNKHVRLLTRLYGMYKQCVLPPKPQRVQGKYSLVPRPFEEEEKRPGIHCTRMCKVYRAFSSIVRRILSLPCSQTRTDKVY